MSKFIVCMVQGSEAKLYWAPIALVPTCNEVLAQSIKEHSAEGLHAFTNAQYHLIVIQNGTAQCAAICTDDANQAMQYARTAAAATLKGLVSPKKFTTMMVA